METLEVPPLEYKDNPNINSSRKLKMGKRNIVQKIIINIFTKNECVSIFVLMYN